LLLERLTVGDMGFISCISISSMFMVEEREEIYGVE
jgi:hypothetical protein